MSGRLTIALAGNPNSGKTTIFNNLTGARQHVGNYPGVTVEKKQGRCTHNGVAIDVVDLPGTYSLTAYSVEELVARRFILEDKPDVVVDVVDASNLERNLYLAVQFMELGMPLVLVFNMSDVARARGVQFDLEKLSRLLGAAIVPTVANRGRGTGELLAAVCRVADGSSGLRPPTIHYGREIDEEIDRIAAALAADGLGAGHNTRWLAIKLLEGDAEVHKLVTSPATLRLVEERTAHLETIFRDRPEILIADRRYGFISGACQEAVRSTVETRHTVSDKIDAVLINQVVGLPIFLGLMYLVFSLTFTLGEWPMRWLEALFGWLGQAIAHLWPRGQDSVLKSLLVDGVVGGVGGVVAFLPNILLLFMGIAFLEDSGYMARAAFLMDRLMHKIGLHGKSFIPMLIGFGCSVPAILATRTLESRRDRLATMLVVPLMSCGARLTIYALIIPAFFPRAWQAPMLWTIYLIGIALAVASAKLLRVTLLRGEAPLFVMELPPYRLPTLRGVMIHMWDRSWMYLRKAGTVILVVSVLLWALTSYPKTSAPRRAHAAAIGQARARLLASALQLNAPLGLPDDSDLIVRAIRTELEADEQQGRHWPNEPAFGAAHQQKLAALAELQRSQGGQALAAFLRARDEIAADEGAAATPEPPAVAAARTYLAEMRAPYDRAIHDLGHVRRAEELAHTVAGRIGHALGAALEPLGFDWRIGTALVGALAAKEVFVAQMGIVFSVGEAGNGSEALRHRLQANYSGLQAFCIMLFCLIAAPCVATTAVTWRESGSWKWAVFQFGALTVVAYVLTLVVYQVGRLVS